MIANKDLSHMQHDFLIRTLTMPRAGVTHC
jgi:hypothetical protein